MVPLATYRLQFNRDFRFRDAIPILDYLKDLGISHIYASPILASRHGSGHGYDLTDPTKIAADLGGEEDFVLLQSALEERGMGLLLDIVPNHMAAGPENRWWMDVLEYGPNSPFASYFDIDWKPPSRTLENKLLLPLLSKPFADALNDGDMNARYEEGRFFVAYGDRRFPVAPSSYAEVLAEADTEAGLPSDSESPGANEWKGILTVARSFANAFVMRGQSAAERRTKFENMRDRLKQLITLTPQFATSIQNALRRINGTPRDPSTFSKLERLLVSQHYRLAFWETTSEAINYRRFFSITDLVGVRVEDPAVFEATHELAIRIGHKDVCAGSRIDHIDGLRDPFGYLTRLRERLAEKGGEPYLIVEKILARNETLPENWPVDGTTGYDFMNCVNHLFVDERQAHSLSDLYSRWIGIHTPFEDIVYEKKKLIMRTLLGVEMRALARELGELSRDDRYARELHPAELAESLVEVTACLPIYRTYIQTLDVPGEAKRAVQRAVESARERRPTLNRSYFDFVSDVLVLVARDHLRPEQREARLAFVTRWQQFTGSIMAKGFEDTALYVYYPLASLNEVGGDPQVTSSTAAEFHKWVMSRQKKWPHSMNSTTTHDTKRSEDTRARIAVLSEMPDLWARHLESWSRANEKYVSHVDGASVPDRNEEYLFYETLVGVWPLQEQEWPTLVSRLQEYLIKAVREAKVHSHWSRPNEGHESALREFIVQVLDRERNSVFCSSFEQAHQCIAPYGMMNGLSQTLLKIMCPGVPDCYQGSELWDLRVVDPDNRNAIDYRVRRAALASENGSAAPEDLLLSWRDARVKLHVIQRSLAARNQNPALATQASYLPLNVSGPHADRIVAFAREYQGAWLIAVVPRCIASVRAPITGAEERFEFWKDTTLRLPTGAPTEWFNLLGGKGLPVIAMSPKGASLGDVFRDFPLALLQS